MLSTVHGAKTNFTISQPLYKKAMTRKHCKKDVFEGRRSLRASWRSSGRAWEFLQTSGGLRPQVKRENISINNIFFSVVIVLYTFVYTKKANHQSEKTFLFLCFLALANTHCTLKHQAVIVHTTTNLFQKHRWYNHVLYWVEIACTI